MGEPIGNAFPRSNHEASLLVMQTLFGWVSDSTKFKRALEADDIVTAHQHA
jgi:ureidoacrylate peracid hydrolase